MIYTERSINIDVCQSKSLSDLDIMQLALNFNRVVS